MSLNFPLPGEVQFLLELEFQYHFFAELAITTIVNKETL